MAFSPEDVSKNLEQLYKQSFTNRSDLLENPVKYANNEANDAAMRAIGMKATSGNPVRKDEQENILSLKLQEAHNANLQNLKEKAGNALKVDSFDTLISKLTKAWETISNFSNGHIFDGIKSLKDGGKKVFTELAGVFNNWKSPTNKKSFMEVLRDDTEKASLNAFAESELGITSPEKRNLLVAQLIGEKPIVQLDYGGSTLLPAAGTPPKPSEPKQNTK